MKKFKYEGCIFGEWTVLEGLGGGKYMAKCSCGTVKKIHISNLTRGLSTNCGCIQNKKTKERMSTHGMSKTPLYNVWRGMINRCENENVNCYHNYGGRGIKVCNEWHNFENFYAWTIENNYVEGLELDRIDCDGNYEPSNCRWVTKLENARNKRDTIMLTINGITKPQVVWEDENNLRRGIIRERLKLGWNKENLLDQPSEERNGRFKALKIEVNGEWLTFKEMANKYGFKAGTLQNRYHKGARGEELIKPLEPRNVKRSC